MPKKSTYNVSGRYVTTWTVENNSRIYHLKRIMLKPTHAKLPKHLNNSYKVIQKKTNSRKTCYSKQLFVRWDTIESINFIWTLQQTRGVLHNTVITGLRHGSDRERIYIMNYQWNWSHPSMDWIIFIKRWRVTAASKKFSFG